MNLRIRSGKSETEVAQIVGININWYYDLEQHDDEVISTLSLSQAMRLAAALGVSLRALLGEEDKESIALTQLPERIKAQIAKEGISVEAFEDRVGWELRKFLETPDQVAADSPIVFLKDLAGALGLSWASLIPDTNAV